MKSEYSDNNIGKGKDFFDRTSLMDQLIAVTARSMDDSQAMTQICELLSGVSVP